jgi:hypothetical protein
MGLITIWGTHRLIASRRSPKRASINTVITMSLGGAICTNCALVSSVSIFGSTCRMLSHALRYAISIRSASASTSGFSISVKALRAIGLPIPPSRRSSIVNTSANSISSTASPDSGGALNTINADCLSERR